MKKFLMLFLITVLSNYCIAQDGSRNVEWSLEGEVLRNISLINSDFKYNLNKKLYLSNWTSFSTKGDTNDQPSYAITSTFVNYKLGDRLVMSFGHRYLDNFTFKSSNNSLAFKVRFKIIK